MTTQKRHDGTRDEAYRTNSIGRVGARPREIESHWIDRPYRVDRRVQIPERQPAPSPRSVTRTVIAEPAVAPPAVASPTVAQATAPRSGSYRGMGPHNYRRSDERIRELVCEALVEDDEVDATLVEVSVSDGVVTLAGAVRDRPSKRMVERVVERIWGVRDIHNALEIVLDRSL